jgi:hypothetical protein
VKNLYQKVAKREKNQSFPSYEVDFKFPVPAFPLIYGEKISGTGISSAFNYLCTR